MSIADKIPGFAPKREVAPQDDGSVIVYVTPPRFMAAPRVSVRLTPDQYERYMQWRLNHDSVQNLLPDLSPDDREKLMCGLSMDD